MSEPLRLRVMTFNIHGGRPLNGRANIPAIADVIRRLEPDLVGLQEVHRYLPHPGVFADQPRQLRRLLGMEVIFRRSFGAAAVGYGNAVLSRIPATSVRRTLLPSHGNEQRAALEARFPLGAGGLRLINTHLGLERAERLDQARTLTDLLGSEGIPTVLVGDLNAEPGSPEVALLEEAGLRHCGALDLLTFPCNAPNCRIDYIMASSEVVVEQAFVGGTGASDHLPLVADLRLP